MTDKLLVLTTAGSENEARKIAHAMVERKLAACVNIVPGIHSVYRWEGKVESAEECLLIIKTTRSGEQQVRTAIRELHSYELPECLAVGIVGGATKVHPAAQASVKLMGVLRASELAEIIVSVGLAQNMAALRALATEGIQRGHMSLHARQVAIAAGATGDLIEKVAARMVVEKVVRIDRAEAILKEMQS